MTNQGEIQKRRTFAIISHPDAGKTTLTEKFLLYGGAVQMAGSVTARRQQRATASDWMELEKKRGISISSTVLQFEYSGYRVNLLDTPGHKDFSEDTYRVLTAVDAVIMVIDAGKGVESQTRKLFEVCRHREIPIFTFMNKLDRPARHPLELIDELEDILQIEVCPVNWPLGNGREFRGVYDRREKLVHLFERTGGAGKFRAPVRVSGLDDPAVRTEIDDDVYAQAVEELGLLDSAGAPFDLQDILSGGTTPVFFGSALNNFGVHLLLDSFLNYAPPPSARWAGENVVSPTDEKFSAFIFKIQANMDPRHRDRIAFLRVCSGEYTPDLQVTHHPSRQKFRLSNARKLFGQERESVETACAGDILGIVGYDEFGIGDTLTEDPGIVYNEIPRFTPEHFMVLRNANSSKFKRFQKGVQQLLQEGVVQELRQDYNQLNTHLLAAVGPLQFEVMQYRLQNEYDAEVRMEPAPYTVLRWVSPHVTAEQLAAMQLPSGCILAHTSNDRPVLLFPAQWALDHFQKNNLQIEFSNLPYEGWHAAPTPAR